MAKPPEPFQFQNFSVAHQHCAHRVGTDGILLGVWIDASKAKNILDFGHGSGLISFLLADRYPECKITGIELDKASYHQSLENQEGSPFRERIQFLQGDFLGLDCPDTFDLIVSNPPYFDTGSTSPDFNRARARSTAGHHFKNWISAWSKALKSNGELSLILPPELWSNHHDDFSEYFTLIRMTKVRHHPLAPVSRLLIHLRKGHSAEAQMDEIILHEQAGTTLRSAQWQRLVQGIMLDQKAKK